MPYSTASFSSSGSLSYALSPIRRSGFSSATKHLEIVVSARVTSCGEADATYTETGIPALYDIAMIFVPLPRLVFPISFPLFSHYESTVYVTFRQVNPSTIMQVSGQCLEYLLKYSSTYPLLKSTMTCLVRWVPVGHIIPRSSSTEDPQMPFMTTLESFQGLPLPSGRRGRSGISGWMTYHCSSVKSTFRSG